MEQTGSIKKYSPADFFISQTQNYLEKCIIQNQYISLPTYPNFFKYKLNYCGNQFQFVFPEKWKKERIYGVAQKQLLKLSWSCSKFRISKKFGWARTYQVRLEKRHKCCKQNHLCPHLFVWEPWWERTLRERNECSFCTDKLVVRYCHGTANSICRVEHVQSVKNCIIFQSVLLSNIIYKNNGVSRNNCVTRLCVCCMLLLLL